MMIDNKPIVAVVDVSEAIARGQTLRLPIFDIGKGVIAGIDRCTAIYADQLVAEGDLQAGKNFKGCDEIISQGRPIGTHLRRQRSPEHGVVRSEEHTSELQSRQYLVCRLLLDKKIPSLTMRNETRW